MIAAMPALPRRARKAHRAVEAVAVGQRDRRKLELGGTLDQLSGRSPLRER